GLSSQYVREVFVAATANRPSPRSAIAGQGAPLTLDRTADCPALGPIVHNSVRSAPARIVWPSSDTAREITGYGGTSNAGRFCPVAASNDQTAHSSGFPGWPVPVNPPATSSALPSAVKRITRIGVGYPSKSFVSLPESIFQSVADF